MDASLCREVLEVILDRPVSQVEHVIAERDIRPSFASHGVRLDAFVQTDNEVYDIEMQTSRKGKLHNLHLHMRSIRLFLACVYV